VEDINRNYGALIALIFNPKLGYTRALKSMGIDIELKYPEGMYEARRKLSDGDAEDIRRMYLEEKLIIAEIAQIYKVSDITISKYMKKHGIQARPRNNRFGSVRG
jgi:hypothetical protein